MPAYNHAKYIRQAIDSAINQTYSNLEIIISDNGSDDGTAEIIRTYTDSRIHKHFFPENTGVFNNGDYCAKHVSGEYVAFLFTDDYWVLTKIEKQVAILEENEDITAVFTHAQIVDDDGQTESLSDHPLRYMFIQKNRTRAEWLDTFFWNSNCLCCPSVLIRKDYYINNLLPLGHSGLYQLSDFYYWIQTVKSGDIFIIQETLTYHRVRGDGGNMSAQNPTNNIRLNNESKLIEQSFFDGIPEDLFIEAFSNYFIKSGKLSKEEILCEQAFLHLKKGRAYMSGPSLEIACEKFHGLLMNPVTRNVLLSEYGFMREDLPRLSASYVTVPYRVDVGSRQNFAKYKDYFTNADYRAAVFVFSFERQNPLLNYLASEGLLNRLSCIIYSGYNIPNAFADIPVCGLESAILKYNINVIIIEPCYEQERLYEKLNVLEKRNIRVIKAYSIFDCIFDSLL
jgi:glycosyltransferase involved in cell wall biosynthesis